MRVAALYDVHGNLPALEAVLAELEELDVDAVVVGGDICLGPMPRPVLDRLLRLGERALFLRGNCDRRARRRACGHRLVGRTDPLDGPAARRRASARGSRRSPTRSRSTSTGSARCSSATARRAATRRS